MPYVICKREFEYNDEYYYSEGEGGVPLHVINDRKEAVDKIYELNIKAFDGLDIAMYDEDIYIGIHDGFYDEQFEAIGVKLVKPERWGGPRLPNGLPFETLKKLADMFPDVRMYSMFEVD